jgi:O-antigen ligase/tetratricopeptide (TPR) repeat protein
MPPKLLVKIIKFLIFAVVIITPLFFIKETVFPAIISKTALFQTLIEAAFFLWLALAVSDKEYRPKFTPVFTSLMAFLAILVVVSALGADPWRSFWSIYERMFGVVVILHMAALAVMVSSVFDDRGRRELLYAALATSLIATVIAFVQMKYPGLLTPSGNTSKGFNIRPGSTFDNPSFLAGYLIFNFFAGVYLLLSRRGKRAPESEFPREQGGRKFVGKALFVFLTAAVLLNAAVIFITQTRGAILGLGLGIFALPIFFAIRPPNLGGVFSGRRLYLAIIVLIIIASSAFWFTRASRFWDNVPGLSRFKDITISFQSEEIQPRITALRAAWHGFLDKPILGWGWENFNIVFNKYYDPKALELSYGETRFDKPHNFFAELMVAGGIPLALAFVVLLYMLFREAWRLSDCVFGQIAIAAIVAFVIQDFFIFDTLGPALMFYLFIGLIDGKYKSNYGVAAESGVKNKNVEKNRVNGGLVACSAAAALAIIYFVNIQTVSAAYYEYWGFQYLANSRVPEGVGHFRSALNEWSPYHFDFAKDYATAMAQAYFYNGDVVPPDEVRFAVSEMEKARDAHPLDAYNHYVLVDMYNQISAIDESYYLPLAEKEADAALKLSPDRQEIYFSLAKTKYLEGKPKEALALIKHAMDLDSNVPDAHFYYGLMSFAVGDTATGYNEIEQSIKMGRKWTIFYEPRTVAGLFADNGHLDEAVGLYSEALYMQPDDTETQIKLGVAYYYQGNKEEARHYLSEASGHFDFTKSLAYAELKPILDDLGL